MMSGRPVAIVRTFKVIEMLVRAPAVDPRIGDMRPVKRPVGNRLRPAVQRERVVEGRRPEPVAYRAARRVAARAGIDEERHPSHAERQRQRIGVRMAGVLVPAEAGRRRHRPRASS